jgi:tRNA(Ile)-lysidine synthase
LGLLLPGFPGVELCVALSGGLDSTSLLAAAAALRGSKGLAVRAVHVHHGIHPNADRWSKHCEKVAARAGVPLTVVRVRVARARGASLEAVAREARYAALAKELRQDEVLLTAHHEDDQLETVLLQLLRGAGIAGLAAMPEVASFAKGRLVRPLLACSRAELESWARTQGLSWVEDDTNADERLDRNYLRRQVLPAMRARWPSAAASVSRSARHAGEARRLLDALALADVERAANGAALSVQRLRALDEDRRRNAVRFWIARAGFALPDTRRLGEIVGPLLDARVGANPEVSWNGVRAWRYADRLSIEAAPKRNVPVGGSTARGKSSANGCEPPGVGLSPPGATPWNWSTLATLPLDGDGGALAIKPDRHGPLDLDALPETLTVRARVGGERLRPSRGRPTKTLKALLQEARVPPAERARLPLLFAADRLIAAGDRWLDASVQADGSTRRRARLQWMRE